MTAKASLIGCLALFCASGCAFDVESDEASSGESATRQSPAEDSVAVQERELPSVDPTPSSCARYQAIVIQGTVVMIPIGCTEPGPDHGDPAPLMPEPSDPLGNPSPYTLPAGVERQNPPPDAFDWDELRRRDSDRRPPD